MIEQIKSALELVSAQNLAYRHWVDQKTVLPYPPFQFVIEPTNYCNIKCLKCPHGHGFERERGFMDMNLYRQILDQMAGSAINLYFMFGGESFLHKQLFEMIRLAKEKGIRRTFLATNGTLLKEKDFSAISESGLDTLTISFDGDDKETYEKLQKGANFDETLDKTVRFLQEKRRFGSAKPFVSVKIIRILKEQPKEIRSEFIRKFDGLPVNRIYSDVLTLQGKYAENLIADDRFGGLLKDEILERRSTNYFPCFNIYHEMAIAWNGKVISCCRDLEGLTILGDVRQNSIQEIWNGEAFVNLRNKLINGQIGGACSFCSSLWLGKPTNPKLRALTEYLTFPKYVIRDNYPNFAKFLFSNPFSNRFYIAKHSNKFLQDAIRKVFK